MSNIKEARKEKVSICLVYSSKIPLYIKWSGWLLGILTGVASMFSISIFYQPGHQYDLTESTVYSTFNSVAWCGLIGWILTMCVTGNGGITKIISVILFLIIYTIIYLCRTNKQVPVVESFRTTC